MQPFVATRAPRAISPRASFRLPVPGVKVLPACFVAALLYFYGNPFSSPRRHIPGAVAPEVPLQVTIRDPHPWTRDRYTYTPLALFRIKALVLLTSYYYFSSEAAVSPLDLTLAWGPLSDQRVIDKISFAHGMRYYSWSSPVPPLSPKVINDNVANMHMIPASKTVKRALMSVREGDVVELAGYLVRITREDGWEWQSSLTRTDSGMGACEVIWVEHAKIIG